jgi:3-methyladenine DNA glycosylase AlkD
MGWSDDIVAVTRSALEPLSHAQDAVAMRTYMKDVAPFLGIKSPPRRAAQRQAWQRVGAPAGPDDLGAAATALFAQPEREFAYAACDLLAKHQRVMHEPFLVAPVEALLLTKPWWDTVDGLGSAAVSPLCRRFPATRAVVSGWSASGERWLVRAAIQHQRGWRSDTDVAFVLGLCGDHAHDREFFVQKAIGWALRDLAPMDPPAVRAFVGAHPDLTRVATREAEKGLARTTSGGPLRRKSSPAE